jgi:hypothetical protein
LGVSIELAAEKQHQLKIEPDRVTGGEAMSLGPVHGKADNRPPLFFFQGFEERGSKSPRGNKDRVCTPALRRLPKLIYLLFT